MNKAQFLKPQSEKSRQVKRNHQREFEKVNTAENLIKGFGSMEDEYHYKPLRLKKAKSKMIKARAFLILLLVLTFICFVASSCSKNYTCKTTTTYKDNDGVGVPTVIPPTSYSVTVNRRDAKKMDGQKVHTFGNGIISDSETKCYK